MFLKPMYDRILVEAVDTQEKTSSGIYIPDTAKEKPIQGVVKAVGDGYRSEKDGSISPLKLKVGDKIFYGKWSGTEVKLDGKDYIIMKESDVLAIA